MKIKKNFLKVGISAVAIIALLSFSTMAFAGSSIADPTKKYSNTAGDLTAFTASDIVIQEEGYSGFTDGFFTIKIPSNVKLHQKSTARVATETISRTTSVLGTSTSPKDLYFYRTSTDKVLGTADLCLKIDNTHASILTVYGSSEATGQIWWSNDGTVGEMGNYSSAATFGLARPELDVMGGTYASSIPVGKIYLDETTNETVIQLAVRGENDGTIHKVYLNDLTLIPADANTTGDVNLSFLDNKADGTGTGFGITNDTGVKVATLVTQPANVTGTALAAAFRL